MDYRLIFIPALMLFSSCNSTKTSSGNENRDKEKQQVIETINSSIGWAKNKDINLLYRTIANDSSFLEVHPGPEVVKGFSEFRKAEEFWMSPDFRAVRYEISDIQVNISQSGTVAWWYCMLDDINEWKGAPANWENTRWTGVMEKRDGKWVIVQQHFSIAGSDD